MRDRKLFFFFFLFCEYTDSCENGIQRADPVPLTRTTMPSWRGPLVLRVSSASLEYSHSKPFSMKVFVSASSLFAFSMKFPVT